jgi:hypothetical protein
VPTPNTNEEHALIELQDLQECKEEALVVVPNTDSDDFYDAYKSHYQYHLSVGEVSVMSLYKACLNLIKAAAMDNKKAIAQLQSEQDRFLSHEFTKALDSEFSTRLKAFNTNSPDYHAAQNSLFILYYSRKYQTTYSSYTDRYQEIFKALLKIKASAHCLDPSLKEFAIQYVKGFPDNITYDALKSSAWKILICELLGVDPVIAVLQKDKEQKLTGYGSPYPFKILSPEKFSDLLSVAIKSDPDFLETASIRYETFIKQIATKHTCSKDRRGAYHINITADSLKNQSLPIIYFVDENNNEVGRFEIEDNAIYFYGHGHDIQLTIAGEIDCASCIIENAGANVNFTGAFTQSQPLYFSAKVKRIALNSQIQSQDDVKFHVQGAVHFHQDASVKTQGPINLRSSSLEVDGNLESQAYFQSHTDGATTVNHLGTCHGAMGVSMSAQIFRDMRGKVTTDKALTLNASDGINLRGSCSLRGPEGFALHARSLMISGKSLVESDATAQINVKEKLIIEKDSNVKAELLHIKSNYIINYSPRISADRIVVNCEDTVENHSTGIFTATESLQLIGGSVWNGGKLHFGKRLDIRLNKCFVHGVASLNSAEIVDAVKNASIVGEDASIIAGVVFGALGSSYVRSLNVSAIVELGAGLTSAKYLRKSRLVSLECNVEIPNLVVIYKDLHDFCKVLEKGDYDAVFGSILSYETLTNLITVAKWIVTTLSPSVGKGVNLLASIFTLIGSLPNLFRQCSDLYQKSLQGEKIEYYDLYKLIATASGIEAQALNLEGQFASVISDGFGSGNVADDLLSNIPSLALSLASLFMPSNTDESLIGVSSGISSNGTLTRRNVLSYEMWHAELGVNVSHNFQVAVQNNQNVLANNVSNIGHDLKRSGNETANTDFVSVDRLNESSVIHAQTVTWMTKDLEDDADVHASIIQARGSNRLVHRGNFSATKLAQLSGGTVSTSSQSRLSGEKVVLTGDDVSNGGKSDAKQFIMMATHTAESTKTSHITAESVNESGKNVKQNGLITLLDPTDADDQSEKKSTENTDKKQDPKEPSDDSKSEATPTDKNSKDPSAVDEAGKPADSSAEPKPAESKQIDARVIIRAEETATLGESSEIDGVNTAVLVMADNVEDAGKADVKELYLIAKETTTLSASAQSTVNYLFASAKNINQASEVIVRDDAKSPLIEESKGELTADGKPAAAQPPTPNVVFSAENVVNMTQQSNIHGHTATALVKGDQVNLAGAINVKTVILDAKMDLNLTETSHIKADKTFGHAKKINQNSVIESTNNAHPVKVAKKPDDSEAKSADAPAEEKQEEPDIVLQADEDLNLGDKSNVSGENAIAYFAGKNVTDNGKTNVDTLIEHAGEQLSTSESASHIARSLISLQAATASLKGVEDALNVDYQIDHGLDINALLTQSGDYSRVKARGLLSIHTSDQYKVNRDLNLTTAVALTCAGFDADSRSIRDSENLSIRTTASGVYLQSTNMRSDKTLAIYSAQGLHSERSNISADILSVETQSDICQFASSMHGDTYTQILDHGRMVNDGLLINGVNGPMYIPSYIQGGTGIGYDGVGAYIVVDQDTFNRGSHIDSVGNIYFNSKKGLQNVAYNYSYTLPQVPTSLPKPSRNMSIKDMMLYMASAPLQMPPTVVNMSVASQIKSDGKTYVISDDGDVRNTQSRILGTETYIHTPKGKIVNLAGLIQGYNYLELFADGNIENRCLESDVPGQYGMMKHYDVAQLIGGSGEGHDGNGLVAQSGAYLINDASEIISTGNNLLSGKQGVISRARFNEYTSYYRRDKKWYGKETTTIDRSFQVQSSLIYSVNGSNTVISEAGAIDSCSTDFIAAHDNNFSAKGPVRLNGYVLTTKEYKDTSNLWGLVDHKTTQYDDIAVPTVVSNPGNTNIVSLSDVELLNASVHAGGKVSIAARNITISAPVLNHTMVSESRGFGYSFPALSMTNFSPLYGDYKALKGSQCGVELAANSWNTGFDALTSVNNIVSGIRSNSLGQTLFPASYLTSVNLNYTRTKTTARSQSVASNTGIDCSGLDLDATDTVTLANGIPIYVAGDAHIRAKIFSQIGVGLRSSVDSSSQAVSLGLSLQGNPNLGVDVSGSHQSSVDYANQILQVAGTVTIDCDQHNMTDANILAARLVEHSKVLSVTSDTNKSSSSSWSASANTNGSYSFQRSNNRSATIGLASGIYTTEGLDITTDKMLLEGAKVVSDGVSHVLAQVVESKSVDEYSRGRTYGVSGNIHDFVDYKPSSAWQPSISNVAVTLGKQDYRASQAATIYVPNSDGLQLGAVRGPLNTANSSGLSVARDDHYYVQVKVPIYSSSRMRKMEDNFFWCKDKLFPENSANSTSPFPKEEKKDLNAAKKTRLDRWKDKSDDSKKLKGLFRAGNDGDVISDVQSNPSQVNSILAQLPKDSAEYDPFENAGFLENSAAYGIKALIMLSAGMEAATVYRLYEFARILNSAPKVGDKVYRVWGDEAGSFGRSWTRINPNKVSNYRNEAGLPDKNTARFASEGRINSLDGVEQRPAIELDGNKGGLDELVIPNPIIQVDLTRVSGVNRPF